MSNSRWSDLGLERSCDDAIVEPRSDWVHLSASRNGVALLEAWFQGRGYQPHRHDTYAIGLTDRGVQLFDYRGATRVSLPGQTVVLHPDEQHDGRAGTEAGFGYRLIYLDPALVSAAVTQLRGTETALPFVRDPVLSDPAMTDATRTAFDHRGDPLALDEAVLHLAEHLLAEDRSAPAERTIRHPNRAAVERARHFLDREKTRVVRSHELETLTGLTRYDLARHFRMTLGTSPYRYLLMRRLDLARSLMATGRPLVDVALESGFADQAHFTRAFRAAYGVSPGQFERLAARSGGTCGRRSAEGR